jgi:hypothetical protein
LLKNMENTPCLSAEVPIPALKAVYRIEHPITVLMLQETREIFRRLNRGTILVPTAGPNSAGMIEAKYKDGFVLVFRRDLDEASQRIEVDAGSGLM